MTRIILTALAVASVPALVCAQPGPLIDRNRVDRKPPAATPAPPADAAPRAPAVVEADASAAPLRAVEVVGSSLPQARFQAALAPFAGQPLTVETISAAAQAAAKVYEGSDIALYTVAAPKQDLAEGRLRLVAIEGRIEQVVLRGDLKGRDMRLVSAYGEKLTRGDRLSRRDLERYLSLIRDVPGLEVKADLVQGRTPGAVVLNLTLKPKRAEVEFSLNNQGLSRLGRYQLQADLSLYSLLRQGDLTDIVIGAPTELERYRYVGVTHSQAIGGEGLRAQISASHLETRPADVPTKGEVNAGSVQLSYPVIRGYERNLQVTGALDGLDSSDAAFGRVIATERTRVLRAAAAWNATSPRRVVALSGTASAGIDGLGARTTAGLADAGFRKLNLAAGADQALGKTFVLRLRATGQFTGDLLPASELFSAGGQDYGRAFPQSVLLGDRAGAASAELAWRPAKAPKTLQGSELYGFADAVRVERLARPGYADARDDDLASAGLGVRMAFKTKTVLGLEGAYALAAPPELGDDIWRFGVRFVTRR